MKALLVMLLILLVSMFHMGRAEDPSAASPPDPYGNLNPSMGVVIVVLIAALFFMFMFYICVRHCCMDASSGGVLGGGSIRAMATRSRRAQRGLDRAVIDSFPTFGYSSVKELKIGKGTLECAVCLNEFQDEDTLRLLPKCDHVFHPECIDTWLGSHTTCPVCRADLVVPGGSETSALNNNINAPVSGTQHDNDQVVVLGGQMIVEEEQSGSQNEENEELGESMEQPLNRNRTMKREISIGGSRWLKRMRFARSFSTGHVAVKQWENMDRFTLRLPGDVRKQLMSGKLVRSTSLVVLPRENSSTRPYRTGFEGSSRGNWFNNIRFGSVRSDRDGQPSQWTFSLVPPFFSRAPSVRSPKPTSGSTREGSIRTEMTRLPV